jgi:hypothetical protein
MSNQAATVEIRAMQTGKCEKSVVNWQINNGKKRGTRTFMAIERIA